jgi:hypothetical protein
MSSVVEFKQIKPAKLKVDKVRLEILNALRAQGKEIVADYNQTVQTWRNKPSFEVAVSLSGGGATVLVTPDGPNRQQFEYVDKGTRPHIIRPRRATVLRFKSTYRAKTSPGVIGSGPGGASGSDVYRQFVNHPGTEARRFSEIIEKRRRKRFQEAMVDAMQRGMEKAQDG